MSRILHIVPGTNDIANGMVVVAQLLAKEQSDSVVVDVNQGVYRIHGNDIEEVYVHGMWLPKEWLACWKALKSGKKLVRMIHGSLSPLYLKHQSSWKKWLVGPIERFFLRRCAKIVATCEAEKGWIERYLGRKCPVVEVTDIKRFFKLGSGGVMSGGVGKLDVVKNSQLITHNSQLHLLYLGRWHPLKGLEFLEEALGKCENVKVWKYGSVKIPNEDARGIIFRVESSVFGEEKEKVWEWCDVLVLPTLSENFGLVIAEALERGKRVITTDGAPAWESECKMGCVKCKVGDGEIWSGYDGRLIYLKGYRDGTREERVELLRRAINLLTHAECLSS